MKKLLYSLLTLTIFWAGCKKDGNQNPPDSNPGLKIEIVSGNNQRDTIGKLLKDSIIIKVTDNGAAAANYTLQYQRSGCEDISIAQRTTSSSGSANYSWYLSGETGKQTLKIIVLDNNGNKKDSISAVATGIAASHGWHSSGCVQNFPVNSFSKLSSGRLFASLNGNNYLYYSDNNAASWLPLKGFTNNYFITKLLASGTSNEVFVATQTSGFFYSPDAGKTWYNRTAGIEDPTGFADMTYTKKGRLIYCVNSGVYISEDKGLTWTQADLDLPSGQSFSPCEQTNGDLYIIGPDHELYKSTNEGSSWNNQGSSVGNYILASVESLYIDSSGNIFVAIPHDGAGTNGEIYESSDKGLTWKRVFSKPGNSSSYTNIEQISKYSSNYYFSFAGKGVYKTADFTTFSNITTRYASYGLLSYTVAANSSFVIGSPGFGVFYYVQ